MKASELMCASRHVKGKHSEQGLRPACDKLFSRMRSEGFLFNSGGLGVEPCSRPVVVATATVRGRALWRSHWAKLLVGFELCFRDKSQLKWRCWWAGVRSERVEIIPNVWCGATLAEATKI